jgi:hypothetical protein
MSGVSSSRTMDLSQLRSVRGDEKPIPLIWRNNKQVIQDLMKRDWLSHTETDHRRLGVFGMRNPPFQILASSPAIFGRSSHSGYNAGINTPREGE